ncbi:hypothetical protein HDU96_008793 [Phlyctochytrium bullatum]|nr:hypothetical protein HDU96_008793 [Phlyctochytrium bullatum]
MPELRIAVNILGGVVHVVLQDVTMLNETQPPRYRATALLDVGGHRLFRLPVTFGEFETESDIARDDLEGDQRRSSTSALFIAESSSAGAVGAGSQGQSSFPGTSTLHSVAPPTSARAVMYILMWLLWLKTLEIAPKLSSKVRKLDKESKKKLTLWFWTGVVATVLFALTACIMSLEAFRYHQETVKVFETCPPADDCIVPLGGWKGFWFEKLHVQVLGTRVLPITLALHNHYPQMKEERKVNTMVLSSTGHGHASVSTSYRLKQGQKVVVNIAAEEWNGCFLELDIHGEGIGASKLNLTERGSWTRRIPMHRT